MSIKVNINKSQADAVVYAYSKQAAERAAGAIQARARQNITSAGRVGNGQMLNGIITEDRTRDAGRPTIAVVSTAKHSRFQEEGTRAHGPVRAKALRFQIRGRGPVIFAKWVRGVKALRFMRRAAEATTLRDFLR